MILVDSSAWIEYDRATGSTLDLRLLELINIDGPVAVTQPIIMEIEAGARSDAHRDNLERLLARFELLNFDVAVDFDGAVAIYRQSRLAGVTPRGLVDCMIASVALRHGASLLTGDSDLVRIAKVVGIDIDASSFAK